MSTWNYKDRLARFIANSQKKRGYGTPQAKINHCHTGLIKFLLKESKVSFGKIVIRCMADRLISRERNLTRPEQLTDIQALEIIRVLEQIIYLNKHW